MPQVDSVQRGTRSVVAGDGTSFTITLGAEVDDGSSIVLHSSSLPTGTSRDYRHTVTVELEASGGGTPGKYDRIRVRRNSAASAATFTFAWEVIEFDPATLGTNGVTRGRDSAFSAGGTVNKTIAVTDIDSAVCTVCWNSSSFSLILSDGSVRASITSTTNLDLVASGTFAGSLEVAWQVIDFDPADVAVQRGTISVNAASSTTTASNTATITAVDTAASLLVGNGMTFPAVTSGAATKWAAGLQLTNSTTVTAYLGGYGSESAGKTMVIGFEVAEFLDGAEVYAGILAFASGDSSKTTSSFSPALDAGRTAGWRVHPDLGNVDTNNANVGNTGVGSFQYALNITTGVDSLTAARSVTGFAVDTFWQVIQFAAAGGGATESVSMADSAITAAAMSAVASSVASRVDAAVGGGSQVGSATAAASRGDAASAGGTTAAIAVANGALLSGATTASVTGALATAVSALLAGTTTGQGWAGTATAYGAVSGTAGASESVSSDGQQLVAVALASGTIAGATFAAAAHAVAAQLGSVTVGAVASAVAVAAASLAASGTLSASFTAVVNAAGGTTTSLLFDVRVYPALAGGAVRVAPVLEAEVELKPALEWPVQIIPGTLQ